MSIIKFLTHTCLFSVNSVHKSAYTCHNCPVINEMLQIYLHGQSLPTLRRRRREKVIFPVEDKIKGI
jgi:hypothetical protein